MSIGESEETNSTPSNKRLSKAYCYGCRKLRAGVMDWLHHECNYNGEKDVCRACNLYLGSKFRYHMKSSKECSNKLKKLFEELKLKQKKETLEISNQMKK